MPAIFSKELRSRTKTACLAKFPVAASIAAGAAKDNAQGQVTINTDTPTMTACTAPPDPNNAQYAELMTAKTSTPHKKGVANRSAIKTISGLLREACSINLTISAKRVSLPSALTFTVTD